MFPVWAIILIFAILLIVSLIWISARKARVPAKIPPNISPEDAANLSNLDPNSISAVPHQREPIPARVTQVIDGDTFWVVFLYGATADGSSAGVPFKIKIRLPDVNAPELNTQEGQHVRDVVKSLIENKIVTLEILRWDKYGGRLDGRITLPDGTDLSSYLISNNLAKAHIYS